MAETEEQRRKLAAEAAVAGVCWHKQDWPHHAAAGTQPDADLVCWSCGRRRQGYSYGPCGNCVAWDRNHPDDPMPRPDEGGDYIRFRAID